MLLRLFDITCFLLSAYIAFVVLGDRHLDFEEYQTLTLLVLLAMSFIFSLTGVYKDWQGSTLVEIVTNLSLSWILVILITGASLFLLKLGEDFSRLWIGSAFGGSFILSNASRILISLFNIHQYRFGQNRRNVVIVGVNELGKKLVKRMLDRPWAGFAPRAMFDLDETLHGSIENGVQVVGGFESISNYIENHRRSKDQNAGAIREVWIALPFSSRSQISVIQELLSDSAAKVRLVPAIESLDIERFTLNETLGMPVIDLSGLRIDGDQVRFKRVLDVVASIIILLTISPLMLFVAALIKLDSPGPVIFRQKRYGLDGREFDLLKFRSMNYERGQFATVEQARINDVRVTRIGRFIRKYSIDELPQLANVLFGEMSLVGPRPHATVHNEYYRTKISGYMFRHTVRPGITGWAQVNGLRGETPQLLDMQERLKYDIYYLKNWSLWLDLRILFKTIYVVVSARGTY